MTDLMKRVRDGWRLAPPRATEGMLKAVLPLHYRFTPGAQRARDYADLLAAAPDHSAELLRALEDAAMLAWLSEYRNLYVVAELLKADQYATLRSACKALMECYQDAPIAASEGVDRGE